MHGYEVVSNAHAINAAEMCAPSRGASYVHYAFAGLELDRGDAATLARVAFMGR